MMTKCEEPCSDEKMVCCRECDEFETCTHKCTDTPNNCEMSEEE